MNVVARRPPASGGSPEPPVPVAGGVNDAGADEHVDPAPVRPDGAAAGASGAALDGSLQPLPDAAGVLPLALGDIVPGEGQAAVALAPRLRSLRARAKMKKPAAMTDQLMAWLAAAEVPPSDPDAWSSATVGQISEFWDKHLNTQAVELAWIMLGLPSPAPSSKTKMVEFLVDRRIRPVMFSTIMAWTERAIRSASECSLLEGQGTSAPETPCGSDGVANPPPPVDADSWWMSLDSEAQSAAKDTMLDLIKAWAGDIGMIVGLASRDLDGSEARAERVFIASVGAMGAESLRRWKAGSVSASAPTSSSQAALELGNVAPLVGAAAPQPVAQCRAPAPAVAPLPRSSGEVTGMDVAGASGPDPAPLPSVTSPSELQAPVEGGPVPSDGGAVPVMTGSGGGLGVPVAVLPPASAIAAPAVAAPASSGGDVAGASGPVAALAHHLCALTSQMSKVAAGQTKSLEVISSAFASGAVPKAPARSPAKYDNREEQILHEVQNCISQRKPVEFSLLSTAYLTIARQCGNGLPASMQSAGAKTKILLKDGALHAVETELPPPSIHDPEAVRDGIDRFLKELKRNPTVTEAMRDDASAFFSYVWHFTNRSRHQKVRYFRNFMMAHASRLGEWTAVATTEYDLKNVYLNQRVEMVNIPGLGTVPVDKSLGHLAELGSMATSISPETEELQRGIIAGKPWRAGADPSASPGAGSGSSGNHGVAGGLAGLLGLSKRDGAALRAFLQQGVGQGGKGSRDRSGDRPNGGSAGARKSRYLCFSRLFPDSPCDRGSRCLFSHECLCGKSCPASSCPKYDREALIALQRERGGPVAPAKRRKRGVRGKGSGGRAGGRQAADVDGGASQ